MHLVGFLCRRKIKCVSFGVCFQEINVLQHTSILLAVIDESLALKRKSPISFHKNLSSRLLWVNKALFMAQ